MNIKDARKLLGVSRDCSLSELNKRYRIMALRMHPDKNGDAPDATAAFQELNAAYNALLPIAKDTMQSNETNETNENATTETYANIFMNFMKSLFRSKSKSEKDEKDGKDGRTTQVLLDLLHLIVHDYASVSVHAVLDSLDPSMMFQLYDILEQYNSAVNMDAHIFEEIMRIIREKMHNNNIIILKPSLKDVIQNNIYVLNVEGQTFYVPLWHSELHYRIEDPGASPPTTKQLIVKCMPELPEHMSIDANNELHIDVRADIRELMRLSTGVLRIPLYDSECLELHVRELHIKSCQTVVLKNNIYGISLICVNDVYDVSNKAPICVHVQLI